jgi:hypothetical protein
VRSRELVVGIGLTGLNVALYAFSLAAARLLAPEEFGELTALSGILVVGNVVSLGLQAAAGREAALGRRVGALVRTSVILAIGFGGTLAALSPLLSPALKFDSPWPLALAGATLVPLVLLGGESGVAQGRDQWRLFAAIQLANGIGRLVGGIAGLLIVPSATSAMVGVALGTWLPVAIGWRLLRSDGNAPLTANALRASHALGAYFLLGSVDILIARARMDAHDAGLYAAGLILAKAAMYLPQFVTIAVFGDLARDETRRARLRTAGVLAGVGALGVAATALFPHLALEVVGGQAYSGVAHRLWLFAAAGSVLALVHLTVIDSLARADHTLVVALWAALALLLAVGLSIDLTIERLVMSVAGAALVPLCVGLLWPAGRTQDSASSRQ